jgi:hypothetical protein
MPEAILQFPSAGTLRAVQATDLAQLVDVEARWENLRTHQPIPMGKVAATLKELQQRQKAYESFFAKLSAYNQRYQPFHVPEQLLNTPTRLAGWCRRMRELYAQVQCDVLLPCTLHVLEKTYRRADRIAHKMKKELVARPAPFDAIPGALQELHDVAVWCDDIVASQSAF